MGHLCGYMQDRMVAPPKNKSLDTYSFEADKSAVAVLSSVVKVGIDIGHFIILWIAYTFQVSFSCFAVRHITVCVNEGHKRKRFPYPHHVIKVFVSRVIFNKADDLYQRLDNTCVKHPNDALL